MESEGANFMHRNPKGSSLINALHCKTDHLSPDEVIEWTPWVRLPLKVGDADAVRAVRNPHARSTAS